MTNDRVPAQRLREIEELKELPAASRTPEQQKRLRALVAKEQLARDKVETALERLAILVLDLYRRVRARNYDYPHEVEEAVAIIAGLNDRVADVEIAFRRLLE